MKTRNLSIVLLGSVLGCAGTGCMHAPGKPMLHSEALRPEQVLDPRTLYKHNCAGCHGDQGQGGAAISLANPIYLATAGIGNIKRITTEGVPETMMPAFGKEQGGLLTEEQISVLSQGMLDAWGHSDALDGQPPLTYATTKAGNAIRGPSAFTVFCARCHGTDGEGTGVGVSLHSGSIVDPSYLALISDQGLRSILISGRPERGMPAWRSGLQSPQARAMTDQEIDDIVAWLATHRTQTPGQPYAVAR